MSACFPRVQKKAKEAQERRALEAWRREAYAKGVEAVRATDDSRREAAAACAPPPVEHADDLGRGLGRGRCD